MNNSLGVNTDTGRIPMNTKCKKEYANTLWKVLPIVVVALIALVLIGYFFVQNNANPADSIGNFRITIALICLILISYALYVILYNLKLSKKITAENARLEQEKQADRYKGICR